MSKLSSIAKTLKKLTQAPAPVLPSSVRSLRVTMAMRNAHFGARHFVKDELPRVAYSNPAVPIHVERKPKAKEEQWVPELVVGLADGTSKTINMHMKHSSKILSELLNITTSSNPASATTV